MNDVVRFCPLASGSSGNCVYVSLHNQHFLIDAGISGKRIQQSIEQLNVAPVGGIFVTHEHSDHINAVGVMARRFKIPVYATPLTWRYFLRHKTIGMIPEEHIKILEPNKPFNINGVTVTAFDVSHDASQPVGYTLSADNIKIAVATDIGAVTDTVIDALCGSHIILIESNHDPDMLENGKYPRILKERVASNRGHLSNASAGMLLAKVAHEGLRYAFLGHLSEENNRPLLAMDTVMNVLDANGVRLPYITVADRHGPCDMVEIKL